MGLGSRLYHGQTRFDIVGRARIWFAISLLVILAGLVSLVSRGLNLGIDFEGGAVWELPAGASSVEDVRDTMEGAGVAEAKVQTLESDAGVRIRVQSESLGVDREQEIAGILAESTGTEPEDVSLNS